MDQLYEVPPGTYKYASRPVFVSSRPGIPSEAEWLVWGSEDKVRAGEVCTVNTYQNGDVQMYIVRLIGARTALKRDGTRVTYVLAEFDRIVEE